MPGWYAKIEHLVEKGQLKVVGRIQEQHPQRCRLFMQWKEMDWSILVDPLNLLDLTSVPLLTLIDENGEARSISAENLAAEFVDWDFVPHPHPSPPAQKPDIAALEREALTGGAKAWGQYGAALYLWGGIERIDAAVNAFRKAADLDADDGRWQFRLGVCLRRRYESAQRQDGDFQAAIQAWGRALGLNPNQYIWRRRLQQYGPRLEKPYPFYDWIHQARQEIQARGEEPTALPVEPYGAEFATPLKVLASQMDGAPKPDPEGKILRDQENFVQVEVVSVPASIKPGGSARIHIILEPNPAVKAHWNNEVESLKLWVDAVPGLALERNVYSLKNPRVPISQESRQVDFEVQCAETMPAGEVVIPTYAMYYVCEDIAGTCMYRRQDIRIPLRIGK